MAGEEPQETGQDHGSDRVSQEKRDETRLRRAIRSRKRQPQLTLAQENGNEEPMNDAVMNPRTVSLCFQSVTYTGGAHGIPTIRAFTASPIATPPASSYRR